MPMLVFKLMFMQDSMLYVVNGLLMLVSFFFCRVMLFPYLYYWWVNFTNSYSTLRCFQKKRQKYLPLVFICEHLVTEMRIIPHLYFHAFKSAILFKLDHDRNESQTPTSKRLFANIIYLILILQM